MKYLVDIQFTCTEFGISNYRSGGDFGPSALLEEHLPRERRRVAFFPGSTIGNLGPEGAQKFLTGLRQILGKTGAAIIGVDLQKPVGVLEKAYNDPEGCQFR